MFYSYNPTKILNGIGALESIYKELTGIDDLVVLHGRSFTQHAFTRECIQQHYPDIALEFIQIPDGDPTLKNVLAFSQQLQGRSPFLLAIGGGRVMDFAKALAVQVGNDFSENEVFVSDHFSWDKTLRIGVVATRPGSGSEANNAFILSDESGWKTSLFSLFTYPEFCIHDPIFFKHLSSFEYRLGLFDAVIHVLDQYIVDRKEALIVDELAHAYLKMLGKLAQTAQMPSASDFQQLAWLGAMISSGILTRGVDASWRCHELAHALASVTHSSHGVSLAFLAHAVFESNSASVPRYKRALESLANGLNHEQSFSLSVFCKTLFQEPLVIDLPENLTELSTHLAKHCPNYDALLIETILRSSSEAN